MAAYLDTVTDEYGRPIEGATVYITEAGGALAALTSDGVVPAANPLLTDESGVFRFHADDNVYGLTVSFGGRVQYKGSIQVGEGIADLALRADLNGDTGSVLVKHKKTGSGTYARTARQWAAVGGMDDSSVFNWIDPDLDAAILDGTVAVSMQTYLQNAFSAVSSAGGIVRFPRGTYRWDRSLYVRSRTQLRGVGKGTVFKAMTPYVGVNAGTYAAQTCQLFQNENFEAATLTDEDISFRDFHIDWNGVTIVGGGAHSISMRHTNRVAAAGVTQVGGENVTALLACRNTLVDNCHGKNLSNCYFDHWDAAEDAVVRNCSGRNDSGTYVAQGIQFTGTGSFDETGRQSANCLVIGNRLRGVRGLAGQSTALHFNVGSGGNGDVDRCVSAFNHIEDSDIGLAFYGSDSGLSQSDTFKGVDQLPIALFIEGSNTVDDVRIVNPHLIDCDHAAGNTALISISGNRNSVTGIRVTNSGAAAYDRIAWITSAAVDAFVSIERAPSGALARVYNQSATSRFEDEIARRPAFLARKSASQTFNVGATPTDIAFGTETFDQGGDFATPSFTAPVAGVYAFEFALMHDNTVTANDRWNVAVVQNSTTVYDLTFLIGAAAFDSIARSFSLQLAAGDTVKLQMRRTSGSGTLTTFNDPTSNYFSGRLVS